MTHSGDGGHPRLHPHRLPIGVRGPLYERRGLRTGIVHFGLGAFARAHLAAATEDALDAGSDPGWAISGVCLRTPGTCDALTPQEGLYTLALRDGASESLRIIGCVRECLFAARDHLAVQQLIAAPGTRILSLTITEKAYRDEGPLSAPGLVAAGLALRRERGLGPLTLMSLDNLPANGAALRRQVLAAAGAVSPQDADWIERECRFPSSMVDRIVPRTTESDRERIDAALGVHDAAPVIGEPFFDWAVEDDFAAGHPGWPGVQLVADVRPWERRKLRMVNGAHSTIAYLGLAAGWATVDEAMRQPVLRRHLEALLRDEVEPTLAGVDLAGYRERLLQRFENPALAHGCAQIAMDGSSKLPQRILDTVRERLHVGGSIRRLSLTVGAWWWHHRVPRCDDPQADALHAHWLACAGDPAGLTSYGPVFGDLAGAPAMVHALGQALNALRTSKVQAMLQSWG